MQIKSTYTLKHNSNAKYLNYTLIYLVCLILFTMHLLKALYNKLIKPIIHS